MHTLSGALHNYHDLSAGSKTLIKPDKRHVNSDFCKGSIPTDESRLAFSGCFELRWQLNILFDTKSIAFSQISIHLYLEAEPSKISVQGDFNSFYSDQTPRNSTSDPNCNGLPLFADTPSFKKAGNRLNIQRTSVLRYDGGVVSHEQGIQ